jgi:hypothetical protein
MKLPHFEEAVVPQDKIEHYLLNPGHPIGGSRPALARRKGRPLPGDFGGRIAASLKLQNTTATPSASSKGGEKVAALNVGATDFRSCSRREERQQPNVSTLGTD